MKKRAMGESKRGTTTLKRTLKLMGYSDPDGVERQQRLLVWLHASQSLFNLDMFVDDSGHMSQQRFETEALAKQLIRVVRALNKIAPTEKDPSDG